MTEKIRNEATHAREREARESLRRDTLNERKNEFQRKMLLELQDAALMLIQATSNLNTVLIVSYQKIGVWHSEEYPPSLDEGTKLANARTASLGVRVRDDEVRKLLQQLKDRLWAAPMHFTSHEKAQTLMIEGGQVFVALNVRIGTVLRTLDEGEQSST